MIQVCDLVRWPNTWASTDRWRVSSHMKRVECTYPKYDKNDRSVDAIVGRMMNGIIRKEVAKERRQRKAAGLPHKRRYKLVWCTPEEATHVNLVAVCGATAPINEVIFERVVPWSEEMIANERASALRLVNLLTFPHYEWE